MDAIEGQKKERFKNINRHRDREVLLLQMTLK